MGNNLTFLICVFLMGTVSAALAADGQNDADLRCMAVMAKLNQVPDPRRQLESLIGGYYYLGRLNAARPEIDLPHDVADAFAKMSAAEFLSETARCEKDMRDLGKSISSIGAEMHKIPPTDFSPNTSNGLQ